MKRLIYPACALLIAGVFLPYVTLTPVSWTGLSVNQHQDLLTFFPWIQLHVQSSKMSVLNPMMGLIFLACALPAGLKPGTHRHSVVWSLLMLATLWVVLNGVWAWQSMDVLQARVMGQVADVRILNLKGPVLMYGAGFYAHVLGLLLLWIELFLSRGGQPRSRLQRA